MSVGCETNPSVTDPGSTANPAGLLSPTSELQDRKWTTDTRFAQTARDLQGFGGLFLDEAGTPVVYLVDLNARSGAEAVLQPLFKELGIRRTAVQFRQGQFDFLQLKEWSDRLLSLLSLPGVASTDIDERRNRLRLGVEDASIRPQVEIQLAQLGIPREAIIIEETGPNERVTTLRDYVRPVRGGLQIFHTTECTLGFNARPWADTTLRTFTTASHCSNVWGSLDGTEWAQPTKIPSSNHIGTEYHDPPFFTGGPCPSGRSCRYSDVTLALYAPAADWDFAYIARTTFSSQFTPGSITIDNANPRFKVTASRWGPTVVGIPWEKIGRTTGWTSGYIINSCQNVNLAPNITMLCSDRVNALADGGDSGSPVFYWFGGTDGTEVTLFGILFAMNTDKTEFIFSSMPNIQSEFQGVGGLRVFPTQSPPPPPPPPCVPEPPAISC